MDTKNHELKSVNDWFLTNKLSLNITKTNYILFRTHHKKLPITNRVPWAPAGRCKVVQLHPLDFGFQKSLPCNFQERIVIMAIIRGRKQGTPYKYHQRPQHPR